MTYRSLILRALVLLAGGAGVSVAMAAAPGTPPNILLLVAEDLSPRIGSYGDQVASTPTLDALATEGVRYTNVFTTAGVCAPSRAALIMGQHQISFSAQHMRTSTSPLGEYYAQPEAGLKAFPELLRRAGYHTFTDGKLDYQFSGVFAGTGPFTIWDEEGPGTRWRQREPGQPFFGMINFPETHESGVMRTTGEFHGPLHEATALRRLQRGLVADAITDPARVLLPSYYPDIREVRADLARHYDNIHAMDRHVGAILAELEADGLAANTIVIWTTDHGDGLPRAKRDLYDSGLHVPLLVRFPESLAPPGWRPGATDSRLVSFVDLAPTILAMAGVAAPDAMHGKSFLTSRREYVFASRDRIDEVMDRQRAVRDRRYKYIRSWYPELAGGHPLAYRDNIDMVRAMRTMYREGRLNEAQRQWFEPVGEEQLYDLEADPDEVDDLSGDPSQQKVLARLRGALIDWLARVGDEGRLPEYEMRNRLLEHGAIPVTPVPEVRVEAGAFTAVAANGASIGYRREDDESWELYTGPVRLTGPLEVKAVRYGWRESAVVPVTP